MELWHLTSVTSIPLRTLAMEMDTSEVELMLAITRAKKQHYLNRLQQVKEAKSVEVATAILLETLCEDRFLF